MRCRMRKKCGIENGCGIKSHFLATLNLQRYRPPFKSRIKNPCMVAIDGAHFYENRITLPVYAHATCICLRRDEFIREYAGINPFLARGPEKLCPVSSAPCNQLTNQLSLLVSA